MRRPTARPTRVRIARRVAAVAAGATLGGIVVAGLATAGVIGQAQAPLPAASPVRLIERDACAAATRPDGVAAGAAQVAVSVGVRPTAMVYLDRDGEITAAWTNTGCAPRPTDDLYTRNADGTIHPAGGDVARRRWSGDFRDAGVPVPQHAAG